MKTIGLIIIGGCILTAVLMALEVLWSRYRIWREELSFDRMLKRNNMDLARRENERQIKKYYDGFKHIHEQGKDYKTVQESNFHTIKLASESNEARLNWEDSKKSPKKPKKNKYGPRPNNLSAAERKRLLKKGMEIIEGGGK